MSDGGAYDFSEDDIERARVVFAGPCDFVAGAATLDRLPDFSAPEIAFAGRSNVGKSSLINAVTGRSALARTSNTPGRTQQLNFFDLGSRLTLVDMPGYGYAKVSKEQKASWDHLIREYLRGRPTLRCVFILIDSRRGIKESDEEIMDMLDESAVSYRVILTKADEESPAHIAKISDDILAALRKRPAAFNAVLATSSEKGTGIAALRAAILTIAES